MKMMKEH